MIDLELITTYISKAERIYSSFTSYTKENPVVGGMIGMWLLGAATYIVRYIPNQISYLFNRYLTVSMTIANREQSYYHILNWLDKNKKMANPRTVRGRNGNWGEGRLKLTPGLGHHYFRDGLRFYRLDRYKEKSDNSTHVKEELRLTTIGFKTAALVKFVESCVPKDQAKSKPEIHIWKDGDWNYLQELSYRSLDSVVLKKGQKERILDFIKEFTQNQEWYERTGVPYRTGILFSGPPGTGKTTMVRALASNLERDLRIINCGMMNDTTIMQALTEVPKNCLILLEDFDSINATKKREDKDKGVDIFGVTLGGLLNAIDGVFSAEGRIIIATTNHPEKLDPALLRPGRFDLKEELGYTDSDMVNRIYKKFFPDQPDINVNIPKGISPAQIENCCLLNKNSAVGALNGIKDETKKV